MGFIYNTSVLPMTQHGDRLGGSSRTLTHFDVCNVLETGQHCWDLSKWLAAQHSGFLGVFSRTLIIR